MLLSIYLVWEPRYWVIDGPTKVASSFCIIHDSISGLYDFMCTYIPPGFGVEVIHDRVSFI